MFIIPMGSGGNMSNKSALALLITIDLAILVCFGILWYLYDKSGTKSSFWDWSTDVMANPFGLAVWATTCIINSIGLITYIATVVENIIFRKDESDE